MRIWFFVAVLLDIEADRRSVGVGVLREDLTQILTNLLGRNGLVEADDVGTAAG